MWFGIGVDWLVCIVIDVSAERVWVACYAAQV